MKCNTKIVIKSLLLFVFMFNINLFAKELKLITEKTFNVLSGELLELKTDAGDINIRTWDKSEISIKVFGNNKAKKKFEFTFDKVDFGLRVIGERFGSGFLNWFSTIKLKYEIILPESFNIELKTSGGDIKITEIKGELDMKTSGGDIELTNSKGELNCKTSGGDISVKDFLGDCYVSTSGGDISLNNIVGEVVASTSGGDVFIESRSGKLKAKTSGGDIQVNYSGRNEEVYLATSGGDIELKIPSDFKAKVQLKTTGGRIRNNFSNSYGEKITKRKFIGTYNSGGESLIAKTSGGSITVSESE